LRLSSLWGQTHKLAFGAFIRSGRERSHRAMAGAFQKQTHSDGAGVVFGNSREQRARLDLEGSFRKQRHASRQLIWIQQKTEEP
jgi:hypothetical protein